MSRKKGVLIVGAGPAGLVAAINLRREGFPVVVQEKQAAIGGEPGWHPSVHTTPVAPAGLWTYIGIDLSEAFADVTGVVRMNMGGVDAGPVSSSDSKLRTFNVERGPRKTSLDSILYRIAEREGVQFEFGKAFRAEDLNTRRPDNTIIATGLSPGLYAGLGIEHTTFAGYWAFMEIEPPQVSAIIYYGVSNEYGYTAAMNGIWYVLVFARREVPTESLEAFGAIVTKTEGYEFGEWRRFVGQTPKAPSLYVNGFVRTGTFAGFIEPALGFGITGSLVSGKIAALAMTDPEAAQSEFDRFTRGIPAHIARKRQPGYVPSVAMGPVWFDIA